MQMTELNSTKNFQFIICKDNKNRIIATRIIILYDELRSS